MNYRNKLAVLLDWDEDVHPRDESGKFAEGGGGTRIGKAEGQMPLFEYEPEPGSEAALRAEGKRAIAAIAPLVDEAVKNANFEEGGTASEWDDVSEADQQKAEDQFRDGASEEQWYMQAQNEAADAYLDQNLSTKDVFDRVVENKFTEDFRAAHGIDLDPDSVDFTQYGSDQIELDTDALRDSKGEEVPHDIGVKASLMFDKKVESAREQLREELQQTSGYEEAVNEAGDEAVGSAWNDMSDSNKFSVASDAGLVTSIEVSPGLPDKWTWDTTDRQDEDYLRTRAVAKELVSMRTVALINERGLGGQAPTLEDRFGVPIPTLPTDRPPTDVGARIGERVWEAWKGSSASNLGVALQMAVADELGVHQTEALTDKDRGRGASAALTEFTTQKEREALGDEKSVALAMGRVKAYVRAQWETSQFVLDKAGTDYVDMYRAVILPKDRVDAITPVTKAEEPPTEFVPHRREQVFTKLPTLTVKLNAVASATTQRSVANGWGGVDVKIPEANRQRVVLRYHAPREAVFSLPVYGENVHEESEVILIGAKAGLKWDAWRGTAPEFKQTPVSMRMFLAAATPKDRLVVDLFEIDKDTGKHWLKGWRKNRERPRPQRMLSAYRRKLRALMLEWDESVHPRNPDGTFGTSGGGPSTVRMTRGRGKATKYSELLDRVRQPGGGFTHKILTGHEPVSGFAVSPFRGRELTMPAEKVTVEKLAEYVSKNRDILREKGAYLGGWHNPEDRQVYLDVSRVVGTKREADDLARRHDQFAYYDLKEGKAINVEGRRATHTRQSRPLPIAAESDRRGIGGFRGGGDWQEADAGRTGEGATDSRGLSHRQKLAVLLDWSAELHPRNPDGTFGEGGGSAVGRPVVSPTAIGDGGEEYRGEHGAPERGDSSTAALDDLTKIYPDDIYGSKASQNYGTGERKLDRQTIAIIHRMKGRPDVSLPVYRAVPKDAPSEINPGDWVTVNRNYAVDHGEGPLRGEYKIVSVAAKASDLFTNGDSIHEWGWQPEVKLAEWNEALHPRGEGGRFGEGGGSESGAAPRVFTSEEGYQWHEQGPVAEWSKGLPKKDTDAIENYAAFGYGDINQQLRGTYEPRIINEFVREATPAEQKYYEKAQPQEVVDKYGIAFAKDVKDFDPDDPTHRTADGRIVHNQFYRNEAGDKVEWSIQRAVPNMPYVKELKASADAINGSIRERGYVLPERIEVARAAYLPGVTEADLRNKVGSVIEENGFTSTMLGDAGGRLTGYVAHGKFESLYKRYGTIQPHEDEVGAAMRIKIDIPAGTKIAAVEAVRRLEWTYERDAEGARQYDKPRLEGTTHGDKKTRRESEVLLGSGARYKVLSVKHGENYESGDKSLKPISIIDVHMEYVGGGSSEGRK